MRDKIGEFKERSIEYYTFFVAIILYPSIVPIGIIYTLLWRWKLEIFSSYLRIAILVNFIFMILILFPLVKLFIHSVRAFRPRKKYLKLECIELDKLKMIVTKTLANYDREYNIELNKKPEHSFSEVLYRKEIFTIKLDNNAFIRIKKNRYFKEEHEVSTKVWDLQYDGTQVENSQDNELLKNLSQRLENHVVD